MLCTWCSVQRLGPRFQIVHVSHRGRSADPQPSPSTPNQYYTLDSPRCPSMKTPSRKTPRRETAQRNGSEKRLGETPRRIAYDEAPYESDHHTLGNTIVSICRRPCADLHISTQCSAPRDSVCGAQSARACAARLLYFLGF